LKVIGIAWGSDLEGRACIPPNVVVF